MTLAIGTNAPTFSLPDTEGNIQSLSDYEGKNLVIAFFPAVFSGVCYLRQAIKSYDVEFHDFAGMDGLTVALRSIFVVDKTGVIQWVWEAPAQGEEPDYGDVKNAIRSLS